MAERHQPPHEPNAAEPQQQQQLQTTPDTVAANTTTVTTSNGDKSPGPVDIDQNDLQYWIDSFKEAAADANGHINSKSPANASSWANGFWDCLSPIETCLMGYFLPCVTFSRTYHRLHKDPNLKDWQPVNTTCLVFCGSSCCLPLWTIPLAMQRAVIRSKFNLQGGCLSDMAWGCCCGCCSIIQMEKEVVERQKSTVTEDSGYQPEKQMVVQNN